MKKLLLIILTFISFSCGKSKEEPLTNIKELKKIINLKITPLNVKYEILKKKIKKDRFVNIGTNDVPDSLSYLVCILQYTDENINLIKKQLKTEEIENNIELIRGNEVYRGWLPLNIKKAFEKYDDIGYMVKNNTYSVNKFLFCNSKSSFCFYKDNYLYVYSDF